MYMFLCFCLPVSACLILVFLLNYYKKRLGFSMWMGEVCLLGFLLLTWWILYLQRLKSGDHSGDYSGDLSLSDWLQAIYPYLLMLLLTLIGWIDLKSERIPNLLNLLLFLLGIGAAICMPDQLPVWHRLAGMLIISLPVLGINLLYPAGFGGGDVKFLAAAGFCLGWQKICPGVFLGSLLAALFCLILLATHQIGPRDKIAFGPYLCAGILILLVW